MPSFAVTVLSLPDTLQIAAPGCEEPANPAVITQRSKDSLLGGLASAVPHFASPAANQGRASTEELGASFIAAGLNWVSRRFAMAHEAHCCPGARLLSPCLALCCALSFPRVRRSPGACKAHRTSSRSQCPVRSAIAWALSGQIARKKPPPLVPPPGQLLAVGLTTTPGDATRKQQEILYPGSEIESFHFSRTRISSSRYG